MLNSSISHMIHFLDSIKRNYLNRAAGFTLIEIIASLMLLAILAAVLGLGLVRAIEVFDFTRNNVQLAQKGQMAMARIARELMELTQIPDNQVPGEDPFIIYERVDSQPSKLRKAIHYHQADQRIRLYTGLDLSDVTLGAETISQGYVLVDGVSDFSLDYFQGAENWTIGSDLNLLSTIRINLGLERPDRPGHPQNFTTLVHLRNTSNMGGAAPSLTPSSTYNSSDFIKTIREPAMPQVASSAATHHRAAVQKSIPAFKVIFIFTGCLTLIGCLPAAIKSRHVRRKWRYIYTNRNGSALVLIITALLIFAIIAASILPLVSSSGQQTAAADWSAKAYLLAESGFRYATSRYSNPCPDSPNEALEKLDDTYTLEDNEGQFELQVYSYFLETADTAEPVNSSTFKAWCPGSFPWPQSEIETTLTGLKLLIGDKEEPYTVDNSSLVPGNKEDQVTNQVTLTVTPELDNIPQSALIRLVADAEGTDGNNLKFKAANASMFPLHNGTIVVGNRILTYAYRDDNTLMDVKDPNDANMVLTVTAGDPIVLMPHVRLKSVGKYGSGVLRTEREIIYNSTLPSKHRVQFKDIFSNQNNWESVSGHHAVGLTGESDNTALLVHETESIVSEGAEYENSLTQFVPSNTGINIGAIHKFQGYLSYDAQVKIGFNVDNLTNYAAGLSFRIDGELGKENMYGISFLHDDSNSIHSDLVPLEGKKFIVLWRQTNGETPTWLAYRDINTLLMEADFETPDNSNWTSIKWQRIENNAINGIRYGISAPENDFLQYEEPEGPESFLRGDLIELSFDSWYKSDDSNPEDYIEICQLNSNNDCVKKIEEYPTNSDGELEHLSIPLCQLSGNGKLRIRFYFNSDTAGDSWIVDNVKITSKWPDQDSTLLVRLVQAAVLEFESGGTRKIVINDRVWGIDSGAFGRVVQDPLLSEGSWENGTAKGLLLLNHVSNSAFLSNEPLLVNGEEIATITGFKKQDHLIRAFYARSEGCPPDGTGNSEPMDAIKKGSPRLENEKDRLRWPPDKVEEWTSEKDFFRLIQWEAINKDSTPPASFVNLINTGTHADQTQTIIRHSEDLQLSDGNLESSEFGLHSTGDGATNVYFDDFGFQIDIASDPVPRPFQQ